MCSPLIGLGGPYEGGGGWGPKDRVWVGVNGDFGKIGMGWRICVYIGLVMAFVGKRASGSQPWGIVQLNVWECEWCQNFRARLFLLRDSTDIIIMGSNHVCISKGLSHALFALRCMTAQVLAS